MKALKITKNNSLILIFLLIKIKPLFKINKYFKEILLEKSRNKVLVLLNKNRKIKIKMNHLNNIFKDLINKIN
jgi:hypothetical protein